VLESAIPYTYCHFNFEKKEKCRLVVIEIESGKSGEEKSGESREENDKSGVHLGRINFKGVCLPPHQWINNIGEKKNVPLSLSLSLYLSIYLSISLSPSPSLSLCECLPLSLSIYISKQSSPSSSVHPFNTSLFLSLFLYIYIYIHIGEGRRWIIFFANRED